MRPRQRTGLLLLPALVVLHLAFFSIFTSRRSPPRRAARVLRQASSRGAEPPPSAGLYGVQQEPGQAVDPKEYGATGQTAEAIETGIRAQGGGPRLRATNLIIKTGATSREGGVYVSDFATAGPGGGYICDAREGEVCEVAPDRFSRAGFVLRNSTDNEDGVNRQGASIETTHTCMCLDSACRHIAEVRAVAVFESEAAVGRREPREHACLLRRRVGGKKFTGCAQSLLVARKRSFREVSEEIKRSSFTVGRVVEEDPPAFPPHVASWSFEFDRPPLRWNAYGYRGYVSAMLAQEFDALPRVNTSVPGLEVDFAVLDEPLAPEKVQVFAFANATEGQTCAETMNWVLHAAAHQATAMDDVGRGVVDGAFVEQLPPRASRTELALSIGQALLGLATLYLLLGDILLETVKLEDRGGGSRHRGFCGMGGRTGWVLGLVCKWPVVLAWLFGLFLLGLEMLAIVVVWIAERRAINTLGKFVRATFVAGVARDTGPIPFAIDETGNVVVVTVIVGSARYTGSNEMMLRVITPICIVFGVVAIVLAILPVTIWRKFTINEMEKIAGDAEQGRGGGGAGAKRVRKRRRTSEEAGTRAGAGVREERESGDIVDGASYSSSYEGESVADGPNESPKRPFKMASYSPPDVPAPSLPARPVQDRVDGLSEESVPG